MKTKLETKTTAFIVVWNYEREVVFFLTSARQLYLALITFSTTTQHNLYFLLLHSVSLASILSIVHRSDSLFTKQWQAKAENFFSRLSQYALLYLR